MTLADRLELTARIHLWRAAGHDVQELAGKIDDDQLYADINTARTFIAAAGDRLDYLIWSGGAELEEAPA